MSRRALGAALAVVYGLLLAMVWRASDWLVPGAARRLDFALSTCVAVIVLAVWLARGTTSRALGLAPSCWRRGWRPALLFTGAGVLALAGLGVWLGSASPRTPRLAWLADYLPGIAAQQILLQGFFAQGVFALASGPSEAARRVATVAICSAAFVGLHAPNPALMVGVAVGGAFWVHHFLVYGNLPAVLVSHLGLGTAAMAALGPGAMLRLRVGPGALDLLLGR